MGYSQIQVEGMSMNKLLAASSLLAIGTLFAGTASADAESFGGVGNRTVTVDPAQAGGYCYSQTGNLQNADIEALGFM